MSRRSAALALSVALATCVQAAGAPQAGLARLVGPSLVPARSGRHGNFLGTRAYRSDPKRNAELGAAFLEALQGQGVAATAKHFPGLGTARANTDSSHVWITTPKRALDARLALFAAAVHAGVEL